MRFDKWAVTAQEALQAAIGIATDANAGRVEPIHLLKALLSSGERNLRAIIERVMTDTMFDLPSIEGVSKCIITEASVLGKEKPQLVRTPLELPQAGETKAQIEGA